MHDDDAAVPPAEAPPAAAPPAASSAVSQMVIFPPPGVGAGQLVRVTRMGIKFELQVPPGTKPGQPFWALLPATTEAEIAAAADV